MSVQNTDPDELLEVEFVLNGQAVQIRVEPRKTLVDTIREDCGLTGTHVGCEHGVCGACTIFVDGQAVRSCLMFAVQADGANVTTVEGLSPPSGPLHPVQQAFIDAHGLQCGFCTPGMLISVAAILERHESLDEETIREELAGNLCRCTGYQGIVKAVQLARERTSS